MGLRKMISIKSSFVLSLLWILFQISEISGQNPTFKVYFFMLEECKITQSYTPEIIRLWSKYQNDSIQMEAIYPAPSSSYSEINQFHKKYQIPLPWKMDSLQSLAKFYHIKVMPEVIIFHQPTKTVLYQGRIDDRWAAIGKRKSRASNRELNDCLENISKGKQFQPFQTEAVGCFLTKL
ncbi:MAG: hypothetical protein IPM48_10800 [Saprospiraceae bacterium]|nr:hypothetical protein [Saprospiraceae bacterium]